MVTIGLTLFTWLILTNPKRKQLLTDNQFSTCLMLGVISGIIGGRLMFVFQNYRSLKSISEIVCFWEGGFSILGTIIAVLITVGIYLHSNKIPVLKLFDLVCIYAPLCQSISRIGCFLAGCCYGLPTNLPWGITYTDPHSCAPLGIALHPTQIYSSLVLFAIFIFMRFGITRWCTITGQITCVYLILAGMERFIVDFWRDDRAYFFSLDLHTFSMNQWIALAMICVAILGFVIVTVIGHRNIRS